MSIALTPIGLSALGLQPGYVASGGGPPPEVFPLLSSPTGTNTGMYSAIGSVVTDTAGGVLYYITTTSASATSAAIKAGNSQPVSAAGKQDISITGLLHTTSYYNHFLHRSADGKDSLVSSSGVWVTATPVVVTAAIALDHPVQHILKNNNGSVYASQPYRCIIVKQSSGAAVAILTGTTSPMGLIGVLNTAGLVAGDDYYVIIEIGAGGAYGSMRVSAA